MPGPISTSPAKISESFNARTVMLYNSFTAPTTVTSAPGTIPAIQALDGANTWIQLPLSPQRWAGRTVKLGEVLVVNGTSAGNLAIRFGLVYRNTALNGVLTTTCDLGGGGDGSVDSGVIAKTAPAVAQAMLLIQSDAIAIPSNITALTIFVGLVRGDALDTNTDSAFINEVRIDEQ